MGLNTELVSSTYPENTKGTILSEHSWIAGLSAFIDINEPAEWQTSRAMRKEPLSDGDAMMVSGELRAEKRTISKISATFFMRAILPSIKTVVNIKL